jgi:monomeric sarcosine oxidase
LEINAVPHIRSQNSPAFDVIVVGAGAMGSAAAYALAQDRRRVLLLEQFGLGHNLGSSHGGSRIIRYTHDNTDYAGQMPATFELWRRLERESGQSLFQLTGGLYAGPEDSPFLRDCRAALSALGFAFRILSDRDLASAYPQFHFPAHWLGLVQDDTGMLAATRCVQTLAARAIARGAELREQTAVLEVSPDGDGVAVRTAGAQGEQTFRADRAVITAGPWANRLLEPLLDFALPLRVTRQQVAYYRARQPDHFVVGRFPVFITVADPHFYGFPIWEEPGAIKVALEQSEVTVDPSGPRQVDAELAARLNALVAAHLPGVNPTPVRVDPCLYTETPTRDFVIDRHPQYPQIVIGAGFSGRGFKHSIAVGRLLADLAQSEVGVYASPFWLERYRITRFAPASAADAD